MDIVAVQKWTYLDHLPDDITIISNLLQNYGQIPREEVPAHLHRIRKAAWDMTRFPCFGRWKFLDLLSAEDPRYKQVLFRLTVRGTRDSFLDLGCCMGQSLRQLRSNGVDASRLYGLDKDARLISIGYDLFQDRKKPGATFVVGDILTDQRLERLRGRITIVHATSFFHLFDWAQQLQIGKVLVTLLKPETRNALIYGRQAGKVGPGRELPGNGGAMFLHDSESFQRLWDEIGAATRTKWVVEVAAHADQDTVLPGLKVEIVAMDFTIHQLSC